MALPSRKCAEAGLGTVNWPFPLFSCGVAMTMTTKRCAHRSAQLDHKLDVPLRLGFGMAASAPRSRLSTCTQGVSTLPSRHLRRSQRGGGCARERNCSALARISIGLTHSISPGLILGFTVRVAWVVCDPVAIFFTQAMEKPRIPQWRKLRSGLVL